MTTVDQDARVRLVLLGEPGLFRASLGRLLASCPGFEVIRECGKSAEALEVLGQLPVDLVLLDFDSGTRQHVDFISQARKARFQVRFLIVTGMEDVRNWTLTLKLGASGIFLKSDAPERLAEAIRVVAQGGAWIDGKALQLIVDHLIDRRPSTDSTPGEPLDSQEQRVLVGIISGLSNRKIADDAGVSENSIKNVVQRLFRKAGVNSRGQLVRVALSGSADHRQSQRKPWRCFQPGL